MSGALFTDRRQRASAAALALVLTSACASAPAAPPTPPITFEQKMSWILQLEDQRVLREPVPEPPPAAAAAAAPRRAGPPVAAPPGPDLVVLVRDPEARIRRRAALAIGRVRLNAGVQPLVATLADADPDVRAMAAFALGILGDPSAEAPLVQLLGDPTPLVRGRAAEALGQLDAKAAAGPIGNMVAEYARHPAVAGMQPDDESWPAAPEAEAFKLGVFALVRLRAFEPLAAGVLDGDRPLTNWWPVAFALQRIADRRAAAPLLRLLDTPGTYTRAFAARGLGAIREPSLGQALLPLLEPSSRSSLEVTVAAIRALAQIGTMEASGPLIRLAADPAVHPNVRLEAVTALGSLRPPEALRLIQDLLTDQWAAMRSAALQAAAAIDEQSFIFVLASLEPDRDWKVRAALAGVLAGLPPEISLDRLRAMLKDEDKRVVPAVLGALARLRPPDIGTILIAHLDEPDFAVRAAAARHIGKLKVAGAPEALRAAYKAGLPDSAYSARAAALDALAELGAGEAEGTLRAALSDKDWAVRVRAADWMAKLVPGFDAESAIRPAPGPPPHPYDDPQLLGPDVSPHVFIETRHGTIELELAVLDAPQTSRNFMALARKGFFNGLEVHRVVANFVVQDGDPRGDGQGSPGYTIRDELNERPYLRGTLGMALAWRDTGGSQFFIAHSPQPHLDGDYTAFGRVVTGMEVVDRMRAGDVITRIRVWDGTSW
jgi:cyclophilin family peptidyl-prolyl cis-trans isomerase/HEAT repeat protein